MSRFRWTDKLLLATLLPLFVVCLALHLEAALVNGIAQAPVFAAPGRGGDPYPSVGGPRLEHARDRSGLQVGDRLLEVGGIDLAGTGYFGFDALAVETAGAEGRTPLVYERDGERREMELELLPYPQPWMRIPFLVSCAALGTVVLLRTPGSRQARLLFAGALGIGIFEMHFFGGSRWQSYASLFLFNFGGAPALAVIFLWAIGFPDEVAEEDRPSRWWAAIAGLFLVSRMPYFLRGPVPTELAPTLVLLADLVLLLTMVSLISWNAWHATPIGRRRFKWVVLSAYFAAAATALSVVAPLVGFRDLSFYETLPFALTASAVFPLGVLVATGRYNLFDIDRLIRSTVVYSIAVAVGLATLVAAAPRIASLVADATGVAPETTQLVIALAVAAVVVPLGRALRPTTERIFFPDRLRFEQGFRILLRDLSDCRSSAEIVTLLGERFATLLRPESVHAFLRTGEHLEAEGDERLPARGALALALEADPHPLLLDERSLAKRVSGAESADTAPLARLGARIVVPVRRGKDLVALLALGPRRSGDIYSSTDLTLLGAAAEKASAEVSRLDDARELDREREHSAQLARLKREAEEANLAKSRFLAAASHDLRQPLHALGLFVGDLAAHVKGEDAAPIVERIRSSTESLSDMLDALLDLSRLDAGAVEPDVGHVALDPILARLADELAPVAREKGIDFDVDGGGLGVRSDPVLLGRILQNLAVNAVRYTEQGSVRITARTRDHDRIEIEVSDTGIGIPEDRQRDVFQQFVQLDTDRPDRAGIGLGLSIVERLAAVLQHPLSLESTVGVGSSFRLSLERSEQAAAAASPPALSSSLAGASILVIDDDLDILEGMRTTLQRWGCHVMLAADLEDALDAIDLRGAPDLVLADQRLANGRTGVEAVDAIRARLGGRVGGRAGTELPAAIVSGEAPAAVREALAARGLPLLRKPVSPVALRAAVTELLRRD